jgi:hypothetical protein
MPSKIACQWEPTGTQDDQGRPYQRCVRCERIWRFHSLAVPVECKDQTRGLGDLVADGIKLATFGLAKPCGGCKERQAWLNRFRVG